MPNNFQQMNRAAPSQAPGGVQILGLQQTLEREEAMREATSPTLPQEIETGLTGHIRKTFETGKQFRVKTDIRLLECLRARRGTYSPQEMSNMQQQGGANIIWMDLTDTKARQAAAWIAETLLPATERAWGVDPEPIPELPLELQAAVVEKAAAEARAKMVQIVQSGGQQMSPTQFRALAAEIGAGVRDEALKASRRIAVKRAERMEDVIDEHMVKGRYRHAMRDFTDFFVTYPTAVLKGPYFANKDSLVWLPGWNLKVENNATMVWSAVNPFDCYPAPNAEDCQRGDFIERLRLRRKDLYAMIGLPGYNEDAIRGALEDYRNGRNEAWLWSEMERRRYENDTIFDWLAPHGVIDALHFWGDVPGLFLLQWGIDPEGIDPQEEYPIDAILIGRYVIRAAINPHPLKKRPYHSASFSRVPGAFWGRSLYDLMKGSQKMCNASACAIADNMGQSAGPMIWLYADRLAPGYIDIDPAPFKVYQLASDKNGSGTAANPGIGSIQIQNYADQLMRVFDKFEAMADKTTGVPSYMAGNQTGAPEVARTLAMLLSAAAKGLRQAIDQIDEHVIEPSLSDVYLYEMLFGTDQSAKGVCSIVPRGSAAILVKDAHLQNQLQALGLSRDPQTIALIGQRGYAELYKEVLKTLEAPVDRIVPSDEELIQREQMQMQQRQQQMQLMQRTGGQTPDKAADRQVKMEKIKADRDIHAATIQKDLTVAAIKHGAQLPPNPSPPEETALGESPSPVEVQA